MDMYNFLKQVVIMLVLLVVLVIHQLQFQLLAELVAIVQLQLLMEVYPVVMEQQELHPDYLLVLMVRLQSQEMLHGM